MQYAAAGTGGGLFLRGIIAMGVLDGLEVLDLSSGISGPLAAMLLADQGARVTRIERPGGDAFRESSGYRVWNRGKRSAEIDLNDPEGRDRVVALASKADVLIESFKPGSADRFGVGYETLAAVNPRLIYCSITGYSAGDPDADRPAIDALVAARMGQQFEVRGLPGGTIARLSGAEGMMPGLDMPEGCWVGPDRDGPLFAGVPWVSMATFYIALLDILAALRARQTTGRGQHVRASLQQGVLATTIAGWQKADNPDVPAFQSWIIDPRAPRGFFQGSDGRWLHHWVPLPDFILKADEHGMRAGPEVPNTRRAALRVSTAPEDMVLLQTYNEQLKEAVGRHPSEEWIRVAAETGVPVQPVRSPEEALLDQALVDDGCVTEVDDPELGKVRQVGRVIDFAHHPARPPAPAPPLGQHTAEVIAEADALRGAGAPAAVANAAAANAGKLSAPLEGVTILDLGLAVAGPFATQILAQLGARVIKVNTKNEKFWYSTHIAMTCNRDKDSIAINLKEPEGMSVLHRLVEKADVVQHNMRYDAAERLGVDYESLRQINPKLIYCHTMGHEQGPRGQDPGNDQTGAALAGTTWLDGGLDHDGRPVWSSTSLGDTGNGFLAAAGIIEALYERERTGEGQFLRTSILYAQLLHASTAWITPDGKVSGSRQKPDREQYGWHALYRLYRTGDGRWLCVAALDQAAWERLASVAAPELATDARFADPEARSANDAELAAALTAAFAGRPAAEWWQALDGAGVPAEVVDPDYCIRMFDDPTALERKLVSPAFPHRNVGHIQMCGTYFDLEDTPARIYSGPIWPGEKTRQILAEFGYTPDEIDKLIESGVADDTAL